METRGYLATRGLALGASLAMMGAGGCYLFGEYRPPADPGGQPTDTGAVAPGPEGRDTADTEKTGEETLPPPDTVGEVRDREVVEFDGGTGDTGEGEVVDTTDTVGADTDTADGGEVDTGLPENQCPSGEPSYRFRPMLATPTVDATCSDVEFSHARSLPIPGPKTTGGEPVNTSDDLTPDCRVVWQKGQPPKMHACCKVEDDNLSEDTDDGDPVEEIYGRGDGNADDRIEFNLRCDLKREDGGCQYKTFTNVRSPTPVHYAFDIKDSGRDSWDDNFKGAAKSTADGYVVEWVADFGFSRQPGDTGLCNFAVFDIDDGNSAGHGMAFGPEATINRPEHWGCCFYE